MYVEPDLQVRLDDNAHGLTPRARFFTCDAPIHIDSGNDRSYTPQHDRLPLRRCRSGRDVAG